MSDSNEEPRVVRRPRRSDAAAVEPTSETRGGSRLLASLAVALLVVGAGATTTAYLMGRADPAEVGHHDAGPAPATPVLSARRVPEFTTAPIPLRALAAAVQPVVDLAPPSTCVTIGDGSQRLYAHNPVSPLVPASNQKLLTAAATLDVLGAEETLTTGFRVADEPTDGVVTGDLYVVGGGDPLLITDGYQSIQRRGTLPETDLEAVADQLVAAGVREVTGSVVGDGSRYDAQRSIGGWPARWLSNGTAGPISALSVNDSWLVDPVTGEGDGGSAADPDQFAAAVMTRLLTDRGVRIAGPPRSGTTPEGTTAVLEVESLPVSAIVGELLAFSDNTTAEMLLKELGVRTDGTGSTAAGLEALAAWGTEAALPTDGWVPVDGSGLSSGNLVTCDLLGAVLRSDGAEGPVAAGLAVPGGGGTLSDRLEDGDWDERLRAKTGTLNDVTSLSGWLLTDPGAMLDFEIVMNTADRQVRDSDLELQEALLVALRSQPVEPPLEAAGPLAPQG